LASIDLDGWVKPCQQLHNISKSDTTIDLPIKTAVLPSPMGAVEVDDKADGGGVLPPNAFLY
jgi:hypothetical protein